MTATASSPVADRRRAVFRAPLDPARRNTVAFYALVAFTIIMLHGSYGILAPLAILRPARLAAALAIASYVIGQVAIGQSIFPKVRELRIVGVLFGWALLTVPLSLWPGGSVDVILELYIKSLTIFWLLIAVVTLPSRLRVLFWVLTGIGVMLAVTAVRQYMSGEFLARARDVTRIAGYGAPLTDNPNDLALVLNVILPLTFAIALGSTRTLHRIVLFGIVALQVGAVLLTFSRGGFLGLAVIIGMYVKQSFRRGRGRSWVLLLVVVALILAAILPSTFWTRITTIWDIDADPTGSAQSRWVEVKGAVSFVLRHPIVGAGLGLDFLAMNDYGGNWKNVHNIYLQYAVDLGVPGFCLFAWLMLSCVKAATVAARRLHQMPGHYGVACLADGIRVSLIGFAVSAFFSPLAYHFPFYYIGALALSARTIAARLGKEAPPPARPRPTASARLGFKAS